MSTTPKPWEKQKGEPAQAFRFFCMYRDMQNRSIKELARLLGRKSARNLEKSSAKYSWSKRAGAWDEEIDRLLVNRSTDDIERMKRRHASLAMGMQSAAAKEINALIHKVEEAATRAKEAAAAEGRDPSKAYHDPILKVSEMLKLADQGVNLERITRGEPTSHVKTEEGEIDYSLLSDEELQALKKIQLKLGKK